MSGQQSEQQASWDLSVARRLVACAARQAPPDLAERLQEEWLADLLARKSAPSRIRFGLGCCWATRIIVREFGVAAVAGGGSASGQRLLVGYGGHDFSWFSRRSTALLAIVLLHVAAFYAYTSGLAQRIVPVSPDWMRGVQIAPEVRTPPIPPPLPKPTFTPTTVDKFPTPLTRFDLPPDPTAITVARSPEPHVAPPVVPAVTRVPGGPGAGFPDSEDYYPPSIVRLGESGATVVSVCVDPRGRLTAAPVIAQSSGIALLDQGALKLATAGSGHYRPTTENGRPVSSCYAFRVRFHLEDQ